MAVVPSVFPTTLRHLTIFFFATFFISTAFISAANAQDRCATFINHPLNKHEKEVEFEKWLNEKINRRKLLQAQGRTQSGPYQIPIVVHVIHNGEPVGTGANIPNEQVYSQIEVLNKDFKRLNADATNTPAEFVNVAGSMDIEFVLAKQAPDGSPTNGIVRVKGSQSSWPLEDYDLLRSESYWDSNDYFNVWVSNIWGDDFSGYIGYSQFPVSDLPGLEGTIDNPNTDGVLIDYRTFGSAEDGAFNLDSRYDKGRTLTHETGHFFGLRHTWGDVLNCEGTDYVDDTPNQDGSTSGCPSGTKESCTENIHKMYQNFLDYTNDACMNLFTVGQIGRMITVIENCVRRTSLLTSHGLLDPNPVADDMGISQINAPKVVSCSLITPSVELKNYGTNTITSVKVQLSINGEVVETKDVTLNLDVFETYELNFSSQQAVAGTAQFVFEILETNTVTDGNPQNDQLAVNTHYFEQSVSMAKIPLREKFEDDFTGQWLVINPFNGKNWETTSTNFNSSMVFESFSNIKQGDEAWLISPPLDLSQTDKASMFFDLSYALNKTRSTSENLRVVASLGCATGFDQVLYNNTGDGLSERSSAISWMPQADTDWSRRFVNLTPLTGNTDVRLAFVIRNGHGNNLFIDNIEFFNSDEPVQPNVSDPFYVYYNPDGDADFYVKFNFPEEQNVRVNIVNSIGQVIYQKNFSNILNETLPVSINDISSGIYVVQFQTPRQTDASRVFIKRGN